MDIECPCFDGVVMSAAGFRAGARIDARHSLRTDFRGCRDVIGQ